MKNIIEKLSDIGLTEKEASVYVAALELGPANVAQIAERAEVKRVTVYPLIESLQKRGLMSSYEEGKKTLFVAEDPSHLERLLEEQERELADKKTDLAKLVDALESRKRTGATKPTVRLFGGLEGLKTINQDLGRFRFKDIITFTRIDLVHKLLPKQKGITSDRIRRKIPTRVMYSTETGPIPNADNPKEYRTTTYLPKDKYPFEGEVTVFGDSVVLASYEQDNPVGVKIEDKGVARTVRTLLQVAWDGQNKKSISTKNARK